MMTPPQTPVPAATHAPAWALYVYGTHAYFTFNGRLIAEACVVTPAQDATIRGIFERLTARTVRRSVQQ